MSEGKKKSRVDKLCEGVGSAAFWVGAAVVVFAPKPLGDGSWAFLGGAYAAYMVTAFARDAGEWRRRPWRRGARTVAACLFNAGLTLGVVAGFSAADGVPGEEWRLALPLASVGAAIGVGLVVCDLAPRVARIDWRDLGAVLREPIDTVLGNQLLKWGVGAGLFALGSALVLIVLNALGAVAPEVTRQATPLLSGVAVGSGVSIFTGLLLGAGRGSRSTHSGVRPSDR